MICPECKAEYVEGIKVCSDCNIDLISLEQLADLEAKNISLDDWETIYASDDPLEAEMVKSNLEGAGIEAVIISKKDSMWLNVIYNKTAPIQLLVKKEDKDQATLILDDINNTQIPEEE